MLIALLRHRRLKRAAREVLVGYGEEVVPDWFFEDGVIFLLIGERAVALNNVIQAVNPSAAKGPAGTTTPEEPV